MDEPAGWEQPEGMQVAAEMVWAAGYGGPAPVTLGRVFTAWRIEPAVLAVVALLGGGYLVGLRRLRAAGGRWPRARTVCFLTGVTTIGVVGLSFLGVYGATLFWVRAVQNLLLLMVAPMLLAWGAPLTLLRDLLPSRARAPLGRLLHSTPARLATFPLLVTVVLIAPLLVLYLSPLYELTLRGALASGLAGVVITGAGFVYFWSRFRIDPTPRADPYLVTLWITVVEMVGDAVLGLRLWLGPLIATDYYQGLGRPWGPDLRLDQIIAAGVIWIGGDLVGLPFLVAVFGRMVREDQTIAAEVDAELDALEATQANPPAGGVDGAGGPGRLWWEDDPQLSPRFRRH